MTSHKTRPELLSALSKAATRQLSADELHRQRVSFAMHAVSDDSVTRDQVERMVSEHEGRAA